MTKHVLEDSVVYVRDNEAANCNCPRQCRQLIYEPTISQAPLSKSIAKVVGKDVVDQTVEEIINDRCIVEVILILLILLLLLLAYAIKTHSWSAS